MRASTPALLLCAGLGTRLRPLTLVRSKPAIPVAGEPMVSRIIRGLAAASVRDIVINLHHLPETVASVVGDGSHLGVRVRYSWEQPQVLGSAGGPRQALDIIGADTFLIVNGDTLTDAPVAPLLEAHVRHRALVTLAVVPNTQPHRYGGVLLDARGAVTGVVRAGSTTPSYHFIGVQAASRRAFEGIPARTFANSIGEVYDVLARREPGSVRGHLCEANFWDVGTVADYWDTSRAFRPSAATAAPSDPPAAVELHDSILWDRVRFAGACRLERCIVTDDVVVADGVRCADAILMRGPDGKTAVVPFSAERQ